MRSTNVLTVKTLSREQLLKVYQAVTKPAPYKVPKPIRKHYHLNLYG